MVLGCGPYHIGKSFLQLLCFPCTLEPSLDIPVVHLFLFSYGDKTLWSTVHRTSIPSRRFAFYTCLETSFHALEKQDTFYYLKRRSMSPGCDFHKVFREFFLTLLLANAKAFRIWYLMWKFAAAAHVLDKYSVSSWLRCCTLCILML